MIDRLNPRDCTGCFACAQKCPIRCIRITLDEEGFARPEIDGEECIRCNACEKVCPQLNPPELNSSKQFYAGRIKNDELLQRSTSGGLFALLALKVLQNGGVVFGAVMEANGNVKTVAVTEITGIASLQGSKYVQSDTSQAFTQAREFLSQGRRVLFCGTPCQIAGLYRYLGERNDNLFTIDLVCHGVPNLRLFLAYRGWLETKYHDAILCWRFRSKDRPGQGSMDRIDFQRRTVFQKEIASPYTGSFLHNYSLRESCYRCQYARPERIGDITLGDFWGIGRYHPEFNAARGASLVLVNTHMGEKLLGEGENDAILLPSRLQWMQTWNSGLVKQTSRPPQRDTLYQNLMVKEINRFVKEDLKVPLPWKERIKMILPYKLKMGIKRMLNIRRARNSGVGKSK